MAPCAVSRVPQPRLWASLLFAGLFLIYNANGREIGGSDSQPTKLAARALALRGNLLLDDDVQRVPQLGERISFAKDQQGHYRSAYSPVGALFGGVTAVALRALGADLNAPRGPNLVAVITASTLVAAAVVLVFLTLRRFGSDAIALAVAIGLGLGTNYWTTLSQTMGQHDVVAFGMALCLYNWMRATGDLGTRHLWMGALGLALAVTARSQVAPLVGMLGLGLIVRVGWKRAAGPLAIAAGLFGWLLIQQYFWFGHPLGALPALERLHPEIHAVEGALSPEPWVGAAGLLVSPNRGLLIFSPVVIVALAGLVRSLRTLPDHGLAWAYAGCLLVFLGYSSYTVWWGGHAYGPRYLLDVMIWLTPAAAVALQHTLSGGFARSAVAVALVWSMVAAGTGAFFADTWNTSPLEVDLHHERLWEWSDQQTIRAWKSGLSPQNFNLFNESSWRTQ